MGEKRATLLTHIRYLLENVANNPLLSPPTTHFDHIRCLLEQRGEQPFIVPANDSHQIAALLRYWARI